MAKALRVLVVVLLLLSIGALLLEVRVFLQREELKGRNLRLMDGVVRLANTVELPPAPGTDLAQRDLPRVTLTPEQLKPFYQLDAAGKPVRDAQGRKVTTGVGTLDGVLAELVGQAGIQYARLNDTRSELTTKREQLAATERKLAETEELLAEARADIRRKEGIIAGHERTIAEQGARIAGLEEAKESLETKVDAQAAEIAKLNDRSRDLDAKLQATERHLEKVQQELARMKAGTLEGGVEPPPPGLQGIVLAVSPNWGFVVLEITEKSKLTPMMDLIVQRGETLVGKVRVSEVQRDRGIAVAEVLPDWKRLGIVRGDHVIY